MGAQSVITVLCVNWKHSERAMEIRFLPNVVFLEHLEKLLGLGVLHLFAGLRFSSTQPKFLLISNI